MPIKPLQLVLALLLHGLVMALLLGGVQCSRKPVTPPIIEAVLLRAEDVTGKPPPPAPKLEPIPEPAPEPQPEPPPKPEPVPEPPKENLAKKAEAAERRQQLIKQEEQRLVAKIEAEAKERVQQQRKAEADEARRILDAVETERKKQAADEALRKRNEEELLRKAEVERKKQEDERRKANERAQQEALLQQQLKAEEDARMAAVRASAQRIWIQQLSRAVQARWLRPPSNDQYFKCKINIRITASGQVISAKPLDSCGSQLMDNSVVNAVFKASPLPLPSEPSAFDPDLNFYFEPPR